MNFPDISHISFADPGFFFLLLLLPFVIFWYVKYRKKQQSSLKVSSLEALQKLPVSWKARLRPLLFVLRCLAYVLLIVALARPRLSDVKENINSNGIDIVLALDVSGSMLAEDFQPNRIEAAKNVAMDFIDHRPTDRIGLVIFAGQSFTQCPITTDHAFLKEQVEKVQSGLLEDGTAIGDGLATCVDRLRNSKAKSKVIILLTDGVNNMGLIDPLTALEIAKAYHIRVYTIGVGTEGNAPYPVPLPGGGTQIQEMPVQIDEALLQKIANETGGEYFRATDNASLQHIYDSIDKMEKTKIEISTYVRYEDLFFPLALAAIALLFLELILRYTLFRSLP